MCVCLFPVQIGITLYPAYRSLLSILGYSNPGEQGATSRYFIHHTMASQKCIKLKALV